MRPSRQGGQVMILTLVFLTILTALVVSLFQVAWAVRERIRLQQAIDLVVLSTLGTEAAALNALAVGNRAILAQDALAGRLNATVSEASFYRKLFDKVGWLVRLIPYCGPLLGQALQRGGAALETLAREVAGTGIPLVGGADTLVAAEADVIRHTLPLSAWRAAKRSLSVNAPEAALHPLSHLALLRQSQGVAEAVHPLTAEERIPLLDRTLDPHSRRRDWSLGRKAAGFPIRKRGRGLAEASDFNAWDKLQFKVLTWKGWRWRTIVSASSRAGDFRYPGHGRLLDLDPEAIPADLTLLLSKKSSCPVFPGKEITFAAVGSGRLHYRRPDRPGERPNLFNPFWTASLIPVSEDREVKEVLPGWLRREVRH